MPKLIKVFAGPNNYHLENVYKKEAGEFIVGVDSALAILLEGHVDIDLAVGDFDSLPKELLERVKRMSHQTIVLETRKDMTDLAYALDYLYNNMDYEKIVIYGGLGGRIDHTIANLNLLKRFDLHFKDDQNDVYTLKKGRHTIVNHREYISFYALEDVYDLSIKGFSYELVGYYLSTSDSLCVSNSGSGEVFFSKGRLLVVAVDEQKPNH